MPTPEPTRTRKARPTRPTEPSEPVLLARDLVKDYVTAGLTTRALDGISLDVHPGSFIAVMGPSGSGKSTLLHLLGGLDSPTSGEVLLGGKQLHAAGDKEMTLARRNNVGFVFQFFNLVPVLSVRENIALPYVIDGRKPDSYRKRLDSLLKVIGLTECAGKLPSEISGGQQQRTAVARALLPNPTVLLADEPTGNLDQKTGHEVMRLIKAAKQKMGQTIVMVTHDATVAAYGDEVIYIEDGTIGGRLSLNGTRPRSKGGDDHRAQAVLAWLQELGA